MVGRNREGLNRSILKLAIPNIISNITVPLLGLVDMMLMGHLDSVVYIGAIGLGGTIFSVMYSIFSFMRAGTTGFTAQAYGANDHQEISYAFYRSMGIALMATVLVLSLQRPIEWIAMQLLNGSSEVLRYTSDYFRVRIWAAPAVLSLYTFNGWFIGMQNTTIPMTIAILINVVNIGLSVLFVNVFHMGVAGVAVATITAQAISAALVRRFLFRSDSASRFSLKTLRIDKNELKLIAGIGLPSGVQGSVFSISNVLIQSSVNSFGSIVMDGNTAAQNIEGFVYISMNSVSQAALTFVSQNYGVKNYDRIKRAVGLSCILAGVVGLILGFAAFGFSDSLISLYSNLEAPNPQVAYYAKIRLSMIATTYLTCGIMDVLSNCVRGIGHSTVSMIVSLLGACAFRVLWIYTVFAADHTLQTLYISYPASWIITDFAHLSCFIMLFKRLKKRRPAEVETPVRS